MVASNRTTIGAYEARTNFAELLRRVESGEEFIITRNGNEVARLVPTKRAYTPEERRAAWERWKESSKGITLGGLTIKELRDEGRR